MSEEESTKDSKWRGEAVPGIGGWKYPLILWQSNSSDGEEKENKLIERESRWDEEGEKSTHSSPLQTDLLGGNTPLSLFMRIVVGDSHRIASPLFTRP